MTLALAGGCVGRQPPVRVDVATTPSMKRSGLLDALLRGIDGVDVRVHATSSARALAMLADGVIDVALTRAPEAEARALAEHPEWTYRKLAYTRFVLVGPAEDPAAVKEATDAVEAFRRIARSPMAFVSHQDQSGVQERERELWRAAAVESLPAHVVIAADNAEDALLQAQERQGYTLADEATLRQMQGRVDLVPLLSDDRHLLSTFALLFARDSAAASWLVDRLAADAARARIAEFTINGTPPFRPWPDACPAGMPDAAPCAAAGARP